MYLKQKQKKKRQEKKKKKGAEFSNSTKRISLFFQFNRNVFTIVISTLFK